jgi:general stress protein 26
MSPTTISYDELKEEFSQQLQIAQHGVLATSDRDYVTAREMMILSDGLKIYFFTIKNSRKYNQLQANKNVALSINNLQVEGVATLAGHPSDSRNAGFIRMFEEKRPEVYEFWRGPCLDPNSDLGVIEITPRKITAYKASPDIEPHLDILNVVTETATRADVNDMSQADYDQY